VNALLIYGVYVSHVAGVRANATSRIPPAVPKASERSVPIYGRINKSDSAMPKKTCEIRLEAHEQKS
jgi:hypothetical protein